jgi:RimJ/RimL family protein N-acetyltransferase
MAIRFATLEDIHTIIDLGRIYHEESRFKHYGFDPDKVASNLRGLIEDKSGARCFFVADDANKRPYAGLIGCIESYFFSNEPVAQTIIFWVHPEHRGGPAALKLVTAFKKWAEKRNAFELAIAVTSAVHIDTSDRFFKKLGFQLTGGNYSLALGG